MADQAGNPSTGPAVAPPAPRHAPDLAGFRAAERVVRRWLPPTPAVRADALSEAVGADVALKLETAQPIRTFKVRGALVKIDRLPSDGGGVVTASAGNHGLAVAFAARLYRRPATVCVPEGANPAKVAAIELQGARVVRHGRDYHEAYLCARELEAGEGLAFVHAYDDPDVVAGQGTLALEALAAGQPEACAVPPFSSVLVGIGGGGLIAGVAGATRLLSPGARVVGVAVEGADSMVRSRRAGRIVALDEVNTIADGLGARSPGELTFAMTQAYVDEIVTVSDDDLLRAMRFLLFRERLLAEPAGAAAVAALLKLGAGPGGPRLPASWGERPLAILSGGNIAPAMLAEVAAQGDPASV